MATAAMHQDLHKWQTWSGYRMFCRIIYCCRAGVDLVHLTTIERKKTVAENKLLTLRTKRFKWFMPGAKEQHSLFCSRKLMVSPGSVVCALDVTEHEHELARFTAADNKIKQTNKLRCLPTWQTNMIHSMYPISSLSLCMFRHTMRPALVCIFCCCFFLFLFVFDTIRRIICFVNFRYGHFSFRCQ